MAINEFETEFQASALTDFQLQNIVKYLYGQGLKVIEVVGINENISIVTGTTPNGTIYLPTVANAYYFVDFCFSRRGGNALTGQPSLQFSRTTPPNFVLFLPTSGNVVQYSQDKKILCRNLFYDDGGVVGGTTFSVNVTGYRILTAPLTP